MKTVCIINYSSPASVYGVGTYINQYGKCILEQGHIPIIINLINEKQNVTIETQHNIKNINIPYMEMDYIDKYHKGIVRIIRLHIADSKNLIFHLHYIQSTTLIDYLKTYYPLAKFLFTIHYLHWSSYLNGNIKLYKEIISNQNKNSVANKYKELLHNYNVEKELFKKLDKIICLSEDTKNLLYDIYEHTNKLIRIIPNGLEDISVNTTKSIDSLKNKYYISNKEHIILFVGRINCIKGIFPLVTAFTKVLNKINNCRLVVIGDGDFGSVLQSYKREHTKITFTGRISKKELVNWYQIADLAVFPSFYEECSYVGIEMMMHGLPIIASDGYSVHCMFKDCALITPIGDMKNLKLYEEQLAQNILKVLNDDNLRKELASKSLKQYKNKYTLKHMSDKYKELLQNL